MGYLSDRRDAKAAEQARDQAAAAYAGWYAETAALRDYLQLVESWRGDTVAGSAGGVLLKPGERVFLVAEGAGLVESRRQAGHWEGRSQGASFRIAKGVSYRVGTNRGHYVQGAEALTPIDYGTAVVTDKRIVYAGPKQTREWNYPKLIGYDHDDEYPWTILQVSNRQKSSGVLYTPESARDIRQRIDLAIACYQGTTVALADAIRHELGVAEAALVQAQAAVAHTTGQTPGNVLPGVPVVDVVTTPAGWYPDPHTPGRQRWWDGTAWTNHFA